MERGGHVAGEASEGGGAGEEGAARQGALERPPRPYDVPKCGHFYLHDDRLSEGSGRQGRCALAKLKEIELCGRARRAGVVDDCSTVEARFFFVMEARDGRLVTVIPRDGPA